MEAPSTQRLRYEDPDPADRGILLSNQIDKLCQEKLLISKNYDPEKLRPASYTLRIGKDFIDSDGQIGRLTDQKDSFVFKKNSIIFVSTEEELDLPYYIIARFNLRVNWVYDGVLLGTGPQVDPGFSGFLSCPLYNLTNVDITITWRQPFATIDFEKTTTLLKDHTEEQKKKVIDNAMDKSLENTSDGKYSFYKTPAMRPLQHRKSHIMVSSLFEMREDLGTWRRLGIGSLIAFFGLTLSLLAFGANLYRQNSDLSRSLVENKSELREANERLSRLEGRIDQLSRIKEPIPVDDKPSNAKNGGASPK